MLPSLGTAEEVALIWGERRQFSKAESISVPGHSDLREVVEDLSCLLEQGTATLRKHQNLSGTR
jgi:hypothetical protein